MKEFFEQQKQLFKLIKDYGYNDEDMAEFIQHCFELLEELYGEQLLRQTIAMLETRLKYGAF